MPIMENLKKCKHHLHTAKSYNQHTIAQKTIENTEKQFDDVVSLAKKFPSTSWQDSNTRKMTILGQSETLGRNSKSMLQHKKLATGQDQITIENHTTIKDIIHDNKLLHSLTAKDKDAFALNGHSKQKTTDTWTMLQLLQKKDIC